MSTPLPNNASRNPLYHLVDHHKSAHPNATYLLSPRSARVVNYAQMKTIADDWTEVVRNSLVPRGARVGLVIGDPIDFATTFVALLSAGLWVAPLDPNVTSSNVAQLRSRVQELRLSHVVSDRPAPFDGDVSWLEGIAGARRNEMSESFALNDNGGGVLLASSGTTGTPKIMALSLDQLLLTAISVSRHNGLDETDRGFSPLPLWHINAEVVGLLATLIAGSSLALDDRFHRTDFWMLIDQLGVTWINAVPAIIARLTVLRDGESVARGVRFMRSASAPLAPALLSQFEAATGIMVVESYGMTEAASQICANPLDGSRKVGSVGRAVGVELRVVPIDGSAIKLPHAPHPIGDVEIKGPAVITRYEAEGYEDRFDDEGWLRTGDLGYLDSDGFLFLVGRSDDVINRGGEKIFPREIEELVLGLRRVVSAAVVGKPDEVFGQVPELYVQIHGVSASTAPEEIKIATKEIHDALVSVLSRVRRPAAINVVERLPAHATGKIQKKNITDDGVTILYRVTVS